MANTNTTIMLKNVRGSFLNVLEESTYNGEAQGYVGDFLFAPDSDEATMVKKAMGAAAKEKWGEKAKAVMGELMKKGRVSLQKGNDKTNGDGDIYAGYEGQLFIKARNSSRPQVFTKTGEAITPENKSTVKGQIPYSGSYLDVLVSIWAQDNNYGKRLNCKLEAVRFRDDGDSLGGSAPISEDKARDAFADAFSEGMDSVEAPENDAFAEEGPSEEDGFFD